MTIVGASIDESVTIACRISADPVKVSFEWTFSNSGERYEVPSGHHSTIQQSFTSDSEHIYLEADENGANGNGTLILFFSVFLLSAVAFPPLNFWFICAEKLLDPGKKNVFYF